MAWTITIDVRDLAEGVRPGDSLTFYADTFRDGPDGKMISTAPRTVYLDSEGRGQLENVHAGDVVVEFNFEGAITDTYAQVITVPDGEGTISLGELWGQSQIYTVPIALNAVAKIQRSEVNALDNVEGAVEAAVESIRRDRGIIPEMPTGAARREYLVSQLRNRKGGRIGTNGKAAIAFRFDRHTDQFRRLIMPILQEHGIPWAQALNSGAQGKGNNVMTWSEIQQLALSTGGDVHNHGRTHFDAEDYDELYYEIVDGLRELQEHLPELPIDGWMQPITGGSFGGLRPFSTEENWVTEAGRLIMAHHAVVYGHKTGWLQRLDGEITIGAYHYTIDRVALESIKARVDEAVGTSSGLVLMLHPNQLEIAGRITVDIFRAAVEYVVELRNEGKLEIVTATGLQLCDAFTSFRPPIASLNLATGRVKTAYLGNTMGAAGPHEVHGMIQARGDVIITVEDDAERIGLSKTIRVEGEQKVWVPFSIPLSSSWVRMSVTGATGGSLTMRAI